MLRLFETLKQADEDFYHRDLYGIPGWHWGAVGDGLQQDRFFSYVRQQPYFPFSSDPFSGDGAIPVIPDVQEADEADVVVVTGDEDTPAGKQVGSIEGCEGGIRRVKYEFMTKKTARIGNTKRQLLACRKGEWRDGHSQKETFEVQKKINKMRCVVKRVAKPDRAVSTKIRFHAVERFDEERFLNDWSLFGPFVPESIQPGSVITEDTWAPLQIEPFDSPTLMAKMEQLEQLEDPVRKAEKELRIRTKMEKAAARAARRRAKHKKKRRWWEMKKKDVAKGRGVPFVFRCLSVRSIQIGKVRCVLETKRIRTHDGSESYTVTKKLGDRKVTVNRKKRAGKSDQGCKKYKNVMPETEADFMRDYETFLGLVVEAPSLGDMTPVTPALVTPEESTGDVELVMVGDLVGEDVLEEEEGEDEPSETPGDGCIRKVILFEKRREEEEEEE